MQNDVLINMLFDLLSERKISAAEFAERYSLSKRQVYRYVDVLSVCAPVQVTQGRNGGISISDTYKLPKGFMTKEEYGAAIEALELAYAQVSDEKFMTAKKKLSSTQKSETRELTLSGQIGTILVDGGGWGDTRKFSDKMRVLEECVKNSLLVEIEYNSRKGETSVRKIEPHVLVYKQGVWYIYAFCRKQRAFRLFRLGRIYSAIVTEEKFERRPIEQGQIPLNYWTDASSVPVKLAVTEKGFADALDWLGKECLRAENENGWIAEANLPFDEVLVKKIISFGKEIKVLSPIELKEQVLSAAKEIVSAYEK